MFIHFKFPSPAPWQACRAALLVFLSAAAHAQVAQTPTLAAALDAAWSLSPNARAFVNRQAELGARQRATEALLSSPPNLTLAHRNDRLASNLGLREYEAELGLPLWHPGVRGATAAQVVAERTAFESQQRTARLAVAAQVRELAANAALARLECALALRKQTEAQALAQDVQRRVTAGDAARIDALLAEAAARQAAALLAQSEAALAQLQGQWHLLTGLAQFAPPEEAVQPPATGSHPLAHAAETKVHAASARLALTEADSRDPLELGVGLARERSVAGEGAQTAVRLSVRIPFGGDQRNAPRLAAARAELDTAWAESDATSRQVQAEVAGAHQGLQAAQRAFTLAAERQALNAEVLALIATSYRLGESDLPTRLRAENERFEAELALARARTELHRATARLNQAQGLLP